MYSVCVVGLVITEYLLQSSLRKLWRVLTRSLKRYRRHTEPAHDLATNDTVSANDMTLLNDEIEQAYSGATSSTPIVPHHPPVLYPAEINFSKTSLISSWDSFSSIESETTASDKSNVSLFESFSNRSMTLSFFSEADESTSDDSNFSPCQLSFNSP